MSYEELKCRLGIEPESPCPYLTPAKPKQMSKLLSFLSDSCYLSSSSQHSPTSTDIALEESLLEQFSTQKLSTSSNSSLACSDPDWELVPGPLLEEERHACFSPYSSGFRPASPSFPQPSFSDDECSSTTSSPIPVYIPHPGVSPLEEGMEISKNEPLSSPSSLATVDFDFNLAPLNDLPALEPMNGENTLRCPIRRSPLSLPELGTSKENPITGRHLKTKTSRSQMEQEGIREALRPLDNKMQQHLQPSGKFEFAHQKQSERRLAKGKESASKRKRRMKVNH